MTQTKEAFKARVREWAEKLDIEIKTISIRPIKKQMGVLHKEKSTAHFQFGTTGNEQEDWRLCNCP